MRVHRNHLGSQELKVDTIKKWNSFEKNIKKIKINKRDSCSDEIFVSKRSPFFFVFFFLQFFFYISTQQNILKNLLSKHARKLVRFILSGFIVSKKISMTQYLFYIKKNYSPFHTNNTKKNKSIRFSNINLVPRLI